MEVTIIEYLTPDLTYKNAVCHKCTCGEFLKDMHEEIERYLKEHKHAKQVDIFWHLDDYCDEKYGACHWQIVSTLSLL